MGKQLSLKRMRREIKVSETRVAAQAAKDFKRFIQLLPWWARLRVCWKIMRKTL